MIKDTRGASEARPISQQSGLNIINGNSTMQNPKMAKISTNMYGNMGSNTQVVSGIGSSHGISFYD